MSARPIGVVTFDLWDCLFRDDSDEPKRSAAGELPKPAARRKLVWEAVNADAPVSQECVDAVYTAVDAAFRKVWHEEHVTWTVAERLRLILEGLGRSLSDEAFQRLVEAHERMELEFRPDPAPGARDALAALHGRFPLAIVSDAIFSPGRALRELLRGEDLLQYFDCCVFSDEVGRSKPHRHVFEVVARHFNVAVEDIVHIGDRPHNDIGGPQAIGARGVLLTVVKERSLAGHKPDAVCADYRELPAVLAALDGT